MVSSTLSQPLNAVPDADRPDWQRIGVMGAAYGNLAALKACVRHAREKKCDGLVFLGDALGFCGHSEAVVEFVTSTFDVIVAGNHELQALVGSNHCACGLCREADVADGCLAFTYATRGLSETTLEIMAEWPPAVILRMNGARLLATHGSPERRNELLYESTVSLEDLTSWLDRYAVDGFLCAHTGFPWTREVDDARVAACCGSVGKPDNDGDPAVHYMIADTNTGSISLEIQRVEYDHPSWADHVESLGVVPVFVVPLRRGTWTTNVAQLPPDERYRYQA